ncbi:hypothetical protein ACFFOL_08775 [Halobaculum roseum]|uniref:Uncharacterized protein n=1 Tax=Halobaculum roseum TaxID=2175149 RepID=A0ABD5MSN2_9EURY|nr:hypothetical protein [Halobaculum roseum]QZY03231.1 hypothetical protein K6T36_03355 [Halobaculum roseum]
MSPAEPVAYAILTVVLEYIADGWPSSRSARGDPVDRGEVRGWVMVDGDEVGR